MRRSSRECCSHVPDYAHLEKNRPRKFRVDYLYADVDQVYVVQITIIVPLLSL